MTSITEGQQQLIDSLICERLSKEGANNIRLVDDFFNLKGEGLVRSLQNEAFEEDENNTTAYYVIKHHNGQILFFFSLRCGLLYDQFLDTRQLELMKELSDRLDTRVQEEGVGKEERETLIDLREKLRTRKGLTKADLKRLTENGESNIFDDIEKELNENISRVGRTFSGIELAHFCSNNQTDDLWEELGLPHSRGTIIFWKFVVNIVLEMVKLVGCQYIFLFAADMTPDGKLINHYKDQMNFRVPDNLATTKPVYDFACKFMCNEVSQLKEQQRLFFANFNPDSV